MLFTFHPLEVCLLIVLNGLSQNNQNQQLPTLSLPTGELLLTFKDDYQRDYHMTWVHAIYLACGALAAAALGLFVITCLAERKLRAALGSSVIFTIFGLLWFGGYFYFSPTDLILAAAMAIVIGFALLYYLPIGNVERLRVNNTDERFDERDVIFSREEYMPGSDKYKTYYARRPEYKDLDDKMRKLPGLLEPGGRYYDSEVSARTDAMFGEIEKLAREVDGPVADQQSPAGADEMARTVKRMLREMGAADVGIAALNPAYVYSHVGRGPEEWGAPISNTHRHVIVFTLEMGYEAVEAAPGLPITEETAARYLQASRISTSLARHIRSLGYSARAHVAGSNYQIILPAVAYDAGLGELGRMGYLISPRLGPRIRLGAVTTDLPLINDGPIAFGVQDFCAKCLKCAANCPSAAIPASEKTDVRGTYKWPLNVEQCYHYWRAIGTDCGLCMKVCPYSHPPALAHNLVRAGIRRSAFARTVSVWGDDLLYGSKVEFD